MRCLNICNVRTVPCPKYMYRNLSKKKIEFHVYLVANSYKKQARAVTIWVFIPHLAQDLWMDATIGMILRISNLAWPCENSGVKLATTRQPWVHLHLLSLGNVKQKIVSQSWYCVTSVSTHIKNVLKPFEREMTVCSKCEMSESLETPCQILFVQCVYLCINLWECVIQK